MAVRIACPSPINLSPCLLEIVYLSRWLKLTNSFSRHPTDSFTPNEIPQRKVNEKVETAFRVMNVRLHSTLEWEIRVRWSFSFNISKFCQQIRMDVLSESTSWALDFWVDRCSSSDSWYVQYRKSPRNLESSYHERANRIYHPIYNRQIQLHQWSPDRCTRDNNFMGFENSNKMIDLGWIRIISRNIFIGGKESPDPPGLFHWILNYWLNWCLQFG
jgi:hypothetical protein